MTIKGKIFLAVLLALTLIALTPAFAAERQKLGDAWWTGPLETSNPNVIPVGHLYIETYFAVTQDNGGGYDNNGNNTSGHRIETNYDSTTLFAYGVAKNFNLQFLPGFGGTQGGSGVPSTTGASMDNLTVRTPYQFVSYKEGKWYPSFSVSPGFIAPTATGQGNVWTPWFGLWAQRPFWMPNGRILRVRVNQDFFFPLQGQKFSATSGVCNGAAACTLNDGKYYKTLIGIEYSLTKKWVPAWDFYWKYGSGNVVNSTVGGARQSCSTFVKANGSCDSFSSFRIDPALEYNFTGNVGVIFGAELTVAGRNSGYYIAPQIALQWYK